MQLFGDNDFRCYIDFQRKKGETIETFSKRFIIMLIFIFMINIQIVIIFIYLEKYCGKIELIYIFFTRRDFIIFL